MFDNRFQGSASLLEACQLCLEDLLVSFPTLPWATLCLFQDEPQLKELGLISHRIQVSRSRLSAHVGHDKNSPAGYSTTAIYSTTRHHLLPLDGAMQKVSIHINTTFSFPSLQQAEPFKPGHPIQASSHKDFQSDWHNDGLRGVLSAKFDGFQDLAHRLLLTTWLLNEANPLAMPLDIVKVVFRVPSPLDAGPLGQIAMELNRPAFERVKRSAFMKPHISDEHAAYIALGSNVDDRMALIESACKLMETRGIEIERTSALYETAPMYYENQQPFINGVCQVRQFL